MLFIVIKGWFPGQVAAGCELEFYFYIWPVHCPFVNSISHIHLDYHIKIKFFEFYKNLKKKIIFYQETHSNIVRLRQEIGGPQAEQLEFVPVGRYSKIAEVREELRPAQIKDRDHIFLILEVEETFLTIHAQKGSLKVKNGVMSTYHRHLP